ncbi:hypothetical protein B6I21_04405 [candidate division KSB1 bacterium 4572_119]|nr:MAG: hypothetical protein B6I21_04405 [candidate division KSB1 bacterium 4572_119]
MLFRILKISFILLFITSVLCPTLLLSKSNQFSWEVGEELTYKVKWSFIRLGTLRLQVCDTLTLDNTFVYHIKLFIDSNPLLFFVNMHNVYETFITEDFKLHLFQSVEKIDNITYLAKYKFNYVDSLIHINMTDMKNPDHTIIKDEPLNETLLDGTSLIYYARATANSTKTDTLISFFESKRGKVIIHYKGKSGKIKIGASEKPIESYYVDGKVDMKGIAGLTGPYKGWFATDSQRPPLIGKLKVFVGYVKVELESWKNWRGEPVLTK